ncbi:PREDICTED: uncharacterized protein LOC104813396 [Tarenaya hassleriana]|uniref:uncharacterized protein LOC104813396 n=1 Tax=Tarenaya hassleriana TaxID=28532 RepID=UPI00053C8012|nr:PREDICTED: uncharacterized protein LOC104813396 [Tarenaya hassleriana]
MAIHLPCSSFKAAAVVTGISAVAATAVNFYAPVISHFMTFYFPVIQENVVLFLRPPYLYLVINCIIVSIVASARLYKNPNLSGDSHSPAADAVAPIPILAPSDLSAYLSAGYVVGYNGSEENNVRRDASVDRTVEISKRFPEVIDEKMVIDGGDDRREMEKLKPSSDSTEDFTPKAEKPPASARFGQGKATKASSEGGNKALGVSKPRRQETLETTWRKITEGRAMPMTRHLKKSDTWEKESSSARGSGHDERTTKSESLDDRSAAAGKRRKESQGRLMREASPGQEELNRRVEAFIKKFNEEMRLQRQESLARYQEMVNRGPPP